VKFLLQLFLFSFCVLFFAPIFSPVKDPDSVIIPFGFDFAEELAKPDTLDVLVRDISFRDFVDRSRMEYAFRAGRNARGRRRRAKAKSVPALILSSVSQPKKIPGNPLARAETMCKVRQELEDFADSLEDNSKKGGIESPKQQLRRRRKKFMTRPKKPSKGGKSQGFHLFS